MNKKMMKEDDDIENVGIMQGLMDSMSEEDDDEEGDDEDPETKLDRRPDTPEILMNNLRGDMRSIEARRDELADLVGYQAATETPESVLAMLQPVLAKQTGGIGALPQSAPMAQGPQPPMMGGAPGMPPPGMPPVPAGMPPMPPGANMPPPPQQGGIAELMAGAKGAGMPPSDQPPIAMARGGYVQNFQEGSDEEGVTPVAQAPSEAGMMFPPEMVAAAQRSSMDLLNRKPSAAPSLEEAAAARLPVYNKLLAADRGASQAQMLFDLGQRAFAFAANTDETGKPLRGSFMSRLAGATRTLPAALGKQLEQISLIDRQIKTLALQQGEKDIDKVNAQNAELEKRKGSLLNEVLRAQAKIEAKKIGGQPSNPFGNSLDGRLMNAFATLGPKAQEGTATPEELRILSLAADKWTQPTMVPIMDPVTNMISGYREVRKTLPKVMMGGGADAGQSVPPLPMDGANSNQSVPPLPMGGGANSNQSVPPMPMGQPGQPAEAEAAASPEISLWRDRFKIAGPINAGKDVISGIPFTGGQYPDVRIARGAATQQAERMIDALLKSTAGSVREQERLQGITKMKPSAMISPEAYGADLITIGQTLRSAMEEYQKQGADNSGLSSSDKGKARQKYAEFSQAYKNLGLPPVVTKEEDLLKYAPGTEVLFNGTKLATVPPR